MTEMHTQEYADRKARLEELYKRGINPYPAKTQFTATPVCEILEQFPSFEKAANTIAVAGRIKSKRLHGGLLFFDLAHGECKIQLYIKKESISQELFTLLSELLDIGDFVEVQGTATTTKRGEKSILVSDAHLLSKALRPLPEKWHGLEDVETRFRSRELDLLSNKKTRDIFRVRSSFLSATRSFLEQEHCQEVETPILQPIPGGAAAKPFVTHHNSLDQDMYLRIAPELYLKRLIIGGFDRVFEVAKCFRNEGIDTQHNPEFTQIELYIAYFDFEALMVFTEKLLQNVIMQVNGSHDVSYQGNSLTFASSLPRITFSEAIKQHCGIDIDEYKERDALAAAAKKQGIEVDKSWGMGKILDELFKKHARPKLIQPQFVTHHPLSLSPLAKKDPTHPQTVERFQLLVSGMEVCNGFSELNDPLDQRERFEEQETLRRAGDDEAQYMDSAFVTALEHGMPPTAGIGIGVDRFVQLLTDSANIKEVILFPTLRNKDA